MHKKTLSHPSSSSMITVTTATEADLPEILHLWHSNYLQARQQLPMLPDWSRESIANPPLLVNSLRAEHGVVARIGDNLVGYLVYLQNEFHQEPSIYVPVIGHAARDDAKTAIYSAMYRELAGRWVGAGCLNHFITHFAHDVGLEQMWYWLGFGLYVVDGYRALSSENLSKPTQCEIYQAGKCDIDVLARLGNESREYYLSSPLFLVRDLEDKEYYDQLLADPNIAVFLAMLDDRPVGFLNVRKQTEPDIIILAEQTTGCIDPIGAYIQPAYRGRGVGSALLQYGLAWCQEKGLSQVHVDFESANLFASAFWPRYFTPTCFSVRRRVNKSILGETTTT